VSETGLSSYRWITLLLATSVQIGVSILQQAPAALGPVLSRALDLSHAQIGLLSSAIWAGMLVTMLPMGIMIDRRGEKMIILVGVAMMIAMVAVATQVATFLWLFLLLLVASFGASSSAPGGAKAIAAWFPRSQRGSAMGIRQTGVALGGLLAALVLPPVAVRFGWAVALQFAVIVTIVTLVCFAFLYKELPADQKDQVKETKPAGVKLGSILKNRSFLAATAYAFVFMGVQGSSASFLALHLHEELRLSIVAAGAFLAVFQVGGMAGRLGWGVISAGL
jgi:nitrate/nitrite transporter NarK